MTKMMFGRRASAASAVVVKQEATKAASKRILMDRSFFGFGFIFAWALGNAEAAGERSRLARFSQKRCPMPSSTPVST